VDYLRRQEVSIEDIAQAAGVSHSTVSRALRDSPLISVDVRERIQHLAREMGYTPNAIAQSLQTQRTSTIGLVVTSIADPFWGDVTKGVEEVARASDFSVFLSASHNDPDQEMAIIETFHRRRVDGILVAASRITSNYKERLDYIRVPTVLINSQAESEARLLHWVSVDDFKGAQLAVEHLLQLGHRSIGYLGISSRPRSNQQRLLGYQSTLAAASVPYRDAWAVITPEDEASHEEDVAAGQISLPRLLDVGVTAIFCYNDMTALGVLVACRERGIAVPGELSVIGFDDIRMASYVTPPLTTVQQPKVQLGRLATQIMLDLLNNRPGRNHLLPPTLILRASTAPLAGG
jgi:DNA-binding LacI/PurR family transcriptional regulator